MSNGQLRNLIKVGENINMIGFVILNYNSYQDTIRCVNSIIDTFMSNKLIIVVDNCSINNSYELLSQYFSDKKFYEVLVLKTDYNGGFSYGNNFGINKLIDFGIKYAIISNSDVIFKDNSINILVKDIINNNDCVIYAPLILNNENKIITLPWKKNQSLIQYLGIKKADNLIYTYDELKNSNPSHVYMASGCCYAVNINYFKKMGGI